MRHTYRPIAVLGLLLFLGLACSLPSTLSSTPPAAGTLNAMYTAAALTVQAANTPAPTATPSPSATSAYPTFSLILPSGTPPPAVVPCNAAAFVRDVTVADGTALDPGQNFIKTWRLKNVGTCAWTSSYSVVFVSGDRMQAPLNDGLEGRVNPGQSIDISVKMTAPSRSASYQGYWKLRNGSGTLFGIGAKAQDAFWVRIRVAGQSYTSYDFVSSYCDADWENNKTSLNCPGEEGDDQGYVLRLNHPILENGNKSSDPGLLTVPRDSNSGLIAGTYPAIKIRNGDRFQALVNCAYKAYHCNVSFQLEYQIGGGRTKTLGTWNEVYEGRYYPIDLDLGSLAGQSVKFTLLVSVNGTFNQDQALWIAPRITRPGTPPPTATSTAIPPLGPTATSTPGNNSSGTPTPIPASSFGGGTSSP